MRAGLLLPAYIVLSAIAHVLLVAAVAVPRHATSHGESIAVDIVPANEVPDLPEVPEASLEPPPPPAPEPQAQQAAAPPPPPEPQAQQKQQTPRQRTQQQPQQPQQQQTQPQQQPSQQAQQQTPPQQQAQPQQQASQPWPEQPQAPAMPAPGSTLAEQQERLMTMLNLSAPKMGDAAAEADTRTDLTSQEKAAFRAHLKSCWQLPREFEPTQRFKIIVRVRFLPNGSLASDPVLIGGDSSMPGVAEKDAIVRIMKLRDAAFKAVKQCAPYAMLPSAKYKEWRELDINFSPDEMAKS